MDQKDLVIAKGSKQKQKNSKAYNRRKILGITSKKDENFSDWYVQVINKAELIEYTEVSGCYVLRPNSFQIWKQIQSYVSSRIEIMGVEDAYFPLFIPEKQLATEENHIDGFAPEVAWVTHSGDTPLNERIAVRPTSETVIYPIYSKWIQSHRDLPLKLNQWCNVVRWEFKSCVPFLRSREFLWQEGHTVHATKGEADREVMDILSLYESTFEGLLAVPVIKGRKTEKEKFAGALYTTTCETFIPGSGKAIQAATSHCLGQNFAKMFNINYEGTDGNTEIPWQNSWGLTTRSIGIMIMIHGDDKGLVLPPKVAPTQVVIIPIYKKGHDSTLIEDYCNTVLSSLKYLGIRTKFDNRGTHNPGFMYSEWELKGVPFQFRIGPKEAKNETIYVVRRDGTRSEIKLENVSSFLFMIEEYQTHLLETARNKLNSHVKKVTNWDDFMTELDEGNILLVPWCKRIECEEAIKHQSVVDSTKEGSAKSLCIPFNQSRPTNNIFYPTETTFDNLEGLKEKSCIRCDNPAKVWCLFGRSY